MISNERPSQRDDRPHAQPRETAGEETIKTERIQIERKMFVVALKENPRGRFLRITEDVHGRHNSIIVPASGLEDFKKLLDEMAKVLAQTPPKTS
jgi:hypothetical protein